jgi:hypothetical protein
MGNIALGRGLGPALMLLVLQLVQGAGCGPLPGGGAARVVGLVALRGGMRGLYDPGPEDPKRRPSSVNVVAGEAKSDELLRELTMGDEMGGKDSQKSTLHIGCIQYIHEGTDFREFVAELLGLNMGGEVDDCEDIGSQEAREEEEEERLREKLPGYNSQVRCKV